MEQIVSEFYLKLRVLQGVFIGDESGQDLIEYALIVAMIALAATAGMGSVATAINAAFVTVGSHVSTYVT